MAIKRDFGIGLDRQSIQMHGRLIAYINIKLASLGLPVYTKEGTAFLQIAREMIEHYREKDKVLTSFYPAVDRRIQEFLNTYLADTGLEKIPRLPSKPFDLDRYGMARELSLPPDVSKYESPTLTSYRVRNGVLHNPANDRRTTQGVFHISEGGLPVPLDKKAVPKIAFAKLLEAAFNPPESLLTLPFTATEIEKAKTFLSLYIRPIVIPEVPGIIKERSMEIRFFVPGSLAANLDFIESIFGNSGDPYIPENDAGLDPEHWTGTSGCIILATHLVKCKKKDLGLPHVDKATERQKKDGMCWKDPEELYNDGKPFKICARDEKGVIVTIIADNYFGYSKKEVKTHISYSSNIIGMCEEEHSGGALVFPSYNHGNSFVPDTNLMSIGQTMQTVLDVLKDKVALDPLGYAVDVKHQNIIYLPENASIQLDDQTASWILNGEKKSIKILPDHIYFHPTGYRVKMDRHPGSLSWRLIGTVAEGTLCHKPCTVSGGGKSEISKSIWDAITYQPIIIGDFDDDMRQIKEIIDKNYGDRNIKPEDNHGKNSRSLLSSKRSLGSVIKLLSPSPLYKDEYNTWLESIPERIKALIFLIKRFYRQEWGNDWMQKFSVDVVNGVAGNVFKFENRPILGSFLRVGFMQSGARWLFKLRQDFIPAEKIQWEDDITTSTIVPVENIDGMPDNFTYHGAKFAKNCEARFFQRPDDAVIRGYDKQTEKDFTNNDNFISNFEPFPREKAKEFREKTVELSEYTQPLRDFIGRTEHDTKFDYFVLSSHPRIVNGAPSKNPRYLQLDPNHIDDMPRYISDIGTRLFRKLPFDKEVRNPVQAILMGRRNNPPEIEAKIRPLAVYGPIHYQELPELFMDFVCSLTGKSPSTTGAGSEGALTKGPFNALVATTDLNNTLLGYILTGYSGFSTAAGYIGHKWKVEHDISLLAPELWSRLTPHEREPAFLLQNGYLEKIDDFEYKGTTVLASRLGYRITPLFAAHFLGRIFDTPSRVFPDEILRPELQNMEYFVDGVNNIVEAQAKVAKDFLDDGSIESAIPPLKALLSIMATGLWEGKTANDPAFRNLFRREYVLESAWYKERLVRYQKREISYNEQSLQYLNKFVNLHEKDNPTMVAKVRIEIANVESKIAKLKHADYLDSIFGTIGLDPLFI